MNLAMIIATKINPPPNRKNISVPAFCGSWIDVIRELKMNPQPAVKNIPIITYANAGVRPGGGSFIAASVIMIDMNTRAIR